MVRSHLLVALIFVACFSGCPSKKDADTVPASPLPAVPGDHSQPGQVAPDVANSVVVDLPEGWVPRAPHSPSVLQAAEHPELNAHLTLTYRPRSQFGNDLMAFAIETRKFTSKQSRIPNRTETELKKMQIAVRHTIVYDILGELGDQPAHGRVVVFEAGDWFCKLFVWTISPNWDAVQPQLETLVRQTRVNTEGANAK
jgi:hypothetical protein